MSSAWDETKRSRIKEVEELMESNPTLKELREKNSEYCSKIRKYDLTHLIEELQPLWTNQHFGTEDEKKQMLLLILEYRMRGMDMEYFTSGAGSFIRTKPEQECIIL